MLAMIAIWPAKFDLSIVASSRGPGGPCLPTTRLYLSCAQAVNCLGSDEAWHA